jgi:hypothetical protein
MKVKATVVKTVRCYRTITIPIPKDLRRDVLDDIEEVGADLVGGTTHDVIVEMATDRTSNGDTRQWEIDEVDIQDVEIEVVGYE